MGKLRHFPGMGYGVAIAAASVVTLVEFFLWHFNEPSICPPALAAVMVSAWFGGMGPGIFAAVLAFAIGEWAPLHDAQHGRPWAVDATNVMRLGTYVMTGILMGLLQASRWRAKAAYRDSREMFRRFMDSIPAAAYVKDEEGRYVYMNRQVERIFGFAPGSWEGKTDGELFPEEVARKFQEDDSNIVATGKSLDTEETIPATDGPRDYMACKFAFVGERGRSYLAGTALDVTEHKKAERERDRLMKQLEAERLRLEAVLQQMPAGVIIADAASGGAVYCNERVAEIQRRAGARPEKEAGRCPWCAAGECMQCAAFHADGQRYAPEEHPLMRAMKRGEAVVNEEMEIVRGDGTRGTIGMNAAPIRNREGKLIAAVCAFHDITEHKRARERQRFLAEATSTLASSLGYETTLRQVAELAVPVLGNMCCVRVMDEDGRPWRLTVAREDPAKEELVRRMQELYPPEEDDPTSVVGKVLRTGQSIRVEVVTDQWLASRARDARALEMLRQFGWTSYMCVAMKARGRTLGAIGFMSTDPSRRYDAGDLALAEELARRAAVAVDNARLYHEAEAANQVKDRFLAMLSHELRTPLTPALIIAEMLEKNPTLSEQMRSSVSTMRRNVELEARLIDDLLDLTRISKGKLTLSREITDVHDAIRAAAEVCQSDVEAKKLRLTLTLEAKEHVVSGDPKRLLQVFWNLIKNAAKFTPEAGSITVRTRNTRGSTEHSGLRTQASGLIIEVCDTGIGIEAKRLSQVFRPFEQGGQEVTRRFGGLGLGLTISKALVEAHGGEIGVASEGNGLGTVFTVTLPICELQLPIDNKHPSAEPQSPIANRELKVLLVEDHADTARTMAMLLATYHCQVRIAGGVQSAVEAAEDEKFDLLISDIELPDGNGADLMRELGEKKSMQGIAISGHGMASDIQRSREAGFIEHLIKPIDLSKLEAALRRAMARVELPIGNGKVRERSGDETDITK